MVGSLGYSIYYLEGTLAMEEVHIFHAVILQFPYIVLSIGVLCI
jgi:hypothetical protein